MYDDWGDGWNGAVWSGFDGSGIGWMRPRMGTAHAVDFVVQVAPPSPPHHLCLVAVTWVELGVLTSWLFLAF